METHQGSEAGEVQSAIAAKFGRLDAGFLLAAKRHLPLVEELLANHDDAGLVALAKMLPRDMVAFGVVYPQCKAGGRHSAFELWLIRAHRMTDVAVYCAMASQHALSKGLLAIEARQKETVVMLHALDEMVSKASRPGTPLLAAAVAGKGR